MPQKKVKVNPSSSFGRTQEPDVTYQVHQGQGHLEKIHTKFQGHLEKIFKDFYNTLMWQLCWYCDHNQIFMHPTLAATSFSFELEKVKKCIFRLLLCSVIWKYSFWRINSRGQAHFRTWPKVTGVSANIVNRLP